LARIGYPCACHAPCLCRSRLPHDGTGEACARGVHEDVVGTCSTRDAKWPRVALKLVGACFSDFSGALVLWLSLLRPHTLVGRETSANTCTRRLCAALGTTCYRNCAEYSRQQISASKGSISGPPSLAVNVRWARWLRRAQTLPLVVLTTTPPLPARPPPSVPLFQRQWTRGRACYLL